MTDSPDTTPTTSEEETAQMLEQARTEAQVRVAELHVEEGTVRSEEGQNSPSPEDHD